MEILYPYLLLSLLVLHTAAILSALPSYFIIGTFRQFIEKFGPYDPTSPFIRNWNLFICFWVFYNAVRFLWFLSFGSNTNSDVLIIYLFYFGSIYLSPQPQVTIPVRFGFQDLWSENRYHPAHIGLLIFDYIGDICFLLDIFLNFR